MYAHSLRFAVPACLLASLAWFSPAQAAQSYDNCTGFIDSLPATISTQGTWCLDKNLGTAITSGNAITIATNNVTIDCNDFKIGGLAAGDASNAKGIYAGSRQNATIRHCNVRGFYQGIHLDGGAGHLVEDNRLDNNLHIGIHVIGYNSLVQHNRVYDTGGRTGFANVYGIFADGDLIDNTVSGLFADDSSGELQGITAMSPGALVRDNRVSGFATTAGDGGAVSSSYGIWLAGDYQRASGNHVSGDPMTAASGTGIATVESSSYCLDNTIGGFTTNIDVNCISDGNLTAP